MQTERVEGHEHSLVHHHGTRPVRLAYVGVGRVAVDGVPAGQVPRVCVDRRVYGYTSADPQNKHACYKSLTSGFICIQEDWAAAMATAATRSDDNARLSYF